VWTSLQISYLVCAHPAAIQTLSQQSWKMHLFLIRSKEPISRLPRIATCRTIVAASVVSKCTSIAVHRRAEHDVNGPGYRSLLGKGRTHPATAQRPTNCCNGVILGQKCTVRTSGVRIVRREPTPEVVQRPLLLRDPLSGSCSNSSQRRACR
jgi:hypothetical protein